MCCVTGQTECFTELCGISVRRPDVVAFIINNSGCGCDVGATRARALRCVALIEHVATRLRAVARRAARCSAADRRVIRSRQPCVHQSRPAPRSSSSRFLRPRRALTGRTSDANTINRELAAVVLGTRRRGAAGRASDLRGRRRGSTPGRGAAS